MQDKLRKLCKKIMASLITVFLMAGNLIIIGNSAYASGNLEVQDEKTTNENVEFGAYFINGR